MRRSTSSNMNRITRSPLRQPATQDLFPESQSLPDSPSSVSSQIPRTASMGENFTQQQQPESDSCPFGCCDRQSLHDYVLQKGFFEGVGSDVTLKAFGTEWKLHKLILCRSGYFSSLFNGPWGDTLDSCHDLVLDHDPYITSEAFELAVSRLYGACRPKAEQHHVLGMIAIGQYLDIPDIVCSATDYVINAMCFDNLAEYTAFATQNNYGTASERIIDSAKGFLASEGWEKGVKAWDGVPVNIIASAIGFDCFFVPSEWERALLIIKCIERRRKLNQKYKDSSGSVAEDLEPLYKVLNTRIYFCHLTAEQLHKLENLRDFEGEPYVEPAVLKEALWLSVLLHKKVSQAKTKDHDLNLTEVSDVSPDYINSWIVPTKDETLYGTPDNLVKNIQLHHQLREDISTNKTTENGPNPTETLFKVTKIPPFRFSIGFTGISELEAEKRVYAKTVWYAGSYWNLYVQKIKHKRGYQMGVYIHRATSGAPSKSGILNRDVSNQKRSSYSRGANITGNVELDSELSNIIQNVNQVSIGDHTEVDFVSSAREGTNENIETEDDDDDDEDDAEEEDDDEDEDDDFDGEHAADFDDSSFLSYEDDRTKTSSYYIIYTPSRKTKASLTCFISKPDLFNKSQSWGWKSNSMCSFNEDGTLAEGQDKMLKFMVVLGNT